MDKTASKNRCEMAGYYHEILEYVENPDAIYEGNCGELIVLKEVQKDKYIVALYREVSKKDGFVITSFTTRKKSQFDRRKTLCKK